MPAAEPALRQPAQPLYITRPTVPPVAKHPGDAFDVIDPARGALRMPAEALGGNLSDPSTINSRATLPNTLYYTAINQELAAEATREHDDCPTST